MAVSMLIAPWPIGAATHAAVLSAPACTRELLFPVEYPTINHVYAILLRSVASY